MMCGKPRTDFLLILLPFILMLSCEDTSDSEPETSSFVGGYGQSSCPGPNCPGSTIPDVSQPDTSVSGATDVQVSADSDTAQPGSDAAEDPSDTNAATKDTNQNDTLKPTKGVLGSACKIASDCVDDLDCVDWKPDLGMCTTVGCGAGLSCPPGSMCVSFGAQIQGCSPYCESSGDCPPGYGCKAVFLPDGTFKKICHAVETGAGGPAATCKSHIQCKGDASCVLQLPGGYCANVGCDAANPCPAGTHCVTVDNVGGLCLAACDAAKVCPGAAVKLQVCSETQDFFGNNVSVCVAGETGKDVGDFCSQNNQCASGECKISANGKCEVGGNGCNSDNDCYQGTCEIKPEYIAGTCVVSCTADKPCPADTVCVPTSAKEGLCRLACKSLSDVSTCDGFAGEACVFGIPLTDKEGIGAYACAPVSSGGMGSPCNALTGQGCAEGYLCLAGSDNQGMCVANCGGKTPAGVDYCPWTGLCFSTGGSTQCQRLCPKNKPLVECPAGFGCKKFEFSSPFPGKPVLVCVPE